MKIEKEVREGPHSVNNQLRVLSILYLVAVSNTHKK